MAINLSLDNTKIINFEMDNNISTIWLPAPMPRSMLYCNSIYINLVYINTVPRFCIKKKLFNFPMLKSIPSSEITRKKWYYKLQFPHPIFHFELRTFTKVNTSWKYCYEYHFPPISRINSTSLVHFSIIN